MNVELITWFAGVLATIYGLKFVIMIFRKIFSKDSMANVMNGIGRGAESAADKSAAVIKGFWKKRKDRNRATVTIH